MSEEKGTYTVSERALATVDQSPFTVVPAWTSARERLIRDNFIPKEAPGDIAEAYIAICRARGLSPEEKHAYLINRAGKWVIQTGIDGFRLIADRTGAYAGSDPAVFGYDEKGNLESATVVVWKFVQGQRCPFGVTAYLDEYRQPSSQTWQKMPRVMLAKCAESSALRKAFPAQLAGLYEPSEMDQAETPTAPTAAPVRASEGHPAVRAQTPRPAPARVVEQRTGPTDADLSWTAFWTEARALGFKDKAAVEKILGSLGSMPPGEVMTRLKASLETDDIAGDTTPADVLDIDPETGEVIPPWVGKDAELPGMATRGNRRADQIAGIN